MSIAVWSVLVRHMYQVSSFKDSGSILRMSLMILVPHYPVPGDSFGRTLVQTRAADEDNGNPHAWEMTRRDVTRLHWKRGTWLDERISTGSPPTW